MKNLQRNERILFIAAGILLLSIILMIAVIPGILNDTSPNSNPKSAVTGILIAMLIHLIIFIAYIKIIRDARRNSKNRKAEYIVIGILLIFFGLIYMDGAFAFLSHENMLYVSFLMFTSVLCDLVASIMTISVFFLNPQKAEKPGLAGIPAWALSLIVFVASIIGAFIFEDVTIPDYSTLGIIGSIFYGILIPVACFIICRIHPKSVWYTPIICNPVGILGAIFHPIFVDMSIEWIFMLSSIVLSVIGAIAGAKIGQRKINQAK